MAANDVVALYEKIMAEVDRAIVGKAEVKQALMLGIIAGGHILIEGASGTGKTRIARSFAAAIGGRFKRIQLTPDMMPADITGFYIYSTGGEARFMEGPLFANVVLADELNRTTPRTQSALLEAMQERQVTIENQTFSLAGPFIVLATQVEAGAEGTYPLTDVQLDRFMLRVASRYPTPDEEKRVLAAIDEIEEPGINTVTTPEEVIRLQSAAHAVYASPEITDYIVGIIDCLRHDRDVLSGPSTRGGIALFKCARVLALLDGRDFIIPDDIKHLAHTAIDHRLRLRPEAEMDEVTPGAVLDRALERVPVPRLTL